ncbi:MAG TPA: hypothetical protein VFL66_00930 [Gaiellaceae bacterium]|nr:hypothetical protein [Gaiellaceae bacterium]
MIDYAVITSDDRKVGHVVDAVDDYLIVEHGHLRKTRHALPKAFAHPVDAEQIVRVTVSKELIAESPRVGDGGIDTHAVARHYGLAQGYDEPDTHGQGEMLPDDPAEGAVVEGQRHGVEPPEKTRAAIREGDHDSSAPTVHGRTPNAIEPGGGRF